MRALTHKELLRVVDANYNRAKEGLRVLEDIARFVFDHTSTTRRYKVIRHTLAGAVNVFGLKDMVAARNITGDVGRATIASESRRGDLGDIVYANVQRAKESLRVLEEFAKLLDARAARRFKELRYKVYDLEKETLGRLSVVSHSRRPGRRV